VSRGRRTAPALVLSVTSLELPARATRDRALEVAGRFREPESLAVTLVKALDVGAEAIYTVPSSRLRAAMRELRRVVPLLARLPLTPPSADLFDEHPLLLQGAGGGGGGVLAAAAMLPMLGASFAGDLAPRVAARCEHEAPLLGARAWAGIAISAPVTDLALAAGNARFFERMLRWGRFRFGGFAGFETENLGSLLTALVGWGIEPDFVVGAVNPAGYAMKPSPDDVLDAMGRSGIPVIATELRAGGTVSLADGAAFARAQGAHGLAPDLVEMDDVAVELRQLASLA
jgi:hypothetical protein